MEEMTSKYALEMIGISKSFPGVRALNNVTLRVRPGTVHALMGENGAGKSTLMKCLFGIYKMDEGTIILNNKERQFASTADAMNAGVSMIHQELSNVPKRSVAQNLWLGREPLNHLHLIDHKKMLEDTRKLLEGLNFNINPTATMGNLSISQQQGCEIARAVSYDATIIVMDEPTSSLTENEVDHLFSIVNNLRETGVAIIYISHKMEEIFQIADEVTVMRDGNYIGTYPITEIDNNKLIALMVGRDNTERFPQVHSHIGEVVLDVQNLTASNPRSFKNISFKLHKGEILGIGGLVGAQRTELVEAVFGIRGISEGAITVKGKQLNKLTPQNAIKAGIGLITEDRRGSGIFPLLNVTTNTTIASLGNYLNQIGLLRHGDLYANAEKYNKQLRTKTPTMQTLTQNLSGGNQQKVILSRWLMTLPDILIMDEPTRGIDVGAKFEIYTIMAELAAEGKAIIMVSSEMPELMGMSHRVIVLCNGRLTGVLEKDKIEQEAIMRLATQF
ncbi:galactose/methyl galactoside import ATP-binding protein MglA [Spirochaetia bacterium]|nr:galactose/methyl galactoside import ATP-binding protein MglA [Spirochaetia bacterium]GHU30059.1 galactose/methyl galactoside import ATP-binding protein MglA [Spirochaetia bacterium]